MRIEPLAQAVGQMVHAKGNRRSIGQGNGQIAFPNSLQVHGPGVHILHDEYGKPGWRGLRRKAVGHDIHENSPLRAGAVEVPAIIFLFEMSCKRDESAIFLKEICRAVA